LGIYEGLKGLVKPNNSSKPHLRNSLFWHRNLDEFLRFALSQRHRDFIVLSYVKKYTNC
jgi:hypothetical protein